MGGALALVSVASVGFAMSAAPDPVAVPEPVPVEAGPPPPPPATPIPADAVVVGAPAAISAAIKTADDSTRIPARPIRVCDQDVDGWVRNESVRFATKKSAVTVQVSAWRAGAAAGAYHDLVADAKKCGQVSPSEGIDQFRTGSSSNDGQWAIGVRRYGDVMVAVSASSLGQDSGRVLDTVMKRAKAELPARLASVCVDPTSTSDKYLAARDPYSPNYNGYQRDVQTSIAAPPVFTKKEIKLVASPSPAATWRGPGGVAYAPWAPLVVPAPGTPISADVATAPRGGAPVLVDPSRIPAPSGSQPSGALGDEPELPEATVDTSVATAPAVDVNGPGCGWAFTATVSPVVTSEEVNQKARQSILDQLAKDTKKQGQTLVQTVAWPRERSEWVKAAKIQADWNAYYSAVSRARTQTAQAKAAYDASVAKWQAAAITGVVPVPAPPPAPVPVP
jgi:hypothetical protein